MALPDKQPVTISPIRLLIDSVGGMKKDNNIGNNENPIFKAKAKRALSRWAFCSVIGWWRVTNGRSDFVVDFVILAPVLPTVRGTAYMEYSAKSVTATVVMIPNNSVPKLGAKGSNIGGGGVAGACGNMKLSLPELIRGIAAIRAIHVQASRAIT